MEVWKIGDVTITRVVETHMTIDPTFLLPEALPDRVKPHEHWLRPHFIEEDGRMVLSIHTFVLESQGSRLLVDTCLGNDKPRPFPEWDQLKLPFLEDLASAGFPRESIDRVLCTHLHVDHVGWNTMLRDGQWVPTFPNARVLIGSREWEFWKDQKDPLTTTVLSDSVQPVFDAGLVELIESNHALTDEVRLIPTPGHTPGHVSVAISSRGEEGVITGDIFHHPIQCAHPEWKDIFDTDHGLARETRVKFLERHADGPVRVLGTHFVSPTAGWIVRDGSAWRFAV